ncbi:MAG: hypothetical protein A2W99_09425 [Bacteroidetes bacterium GWF2_33_16]|nr:MAG: hypothetical protein A2X00_06335 [Bacteroidetes bacterium GWE2_32_14]OFY07217.1 MAG: hypothetical protein A2W99_09425 [Bacteroidetes bacterium GWF2_33_16]
MKKSFSFLNKLASLSILVCLFAFIIINYEAKAQNVAITDIDDYTAESSAMLDVKSTTKGMLIPRLTTLQRTTLTTTAVEGLMVYDTNFNSFFYFSNGIWTIIPKVTSSVGIGVALFAIVNATGDTIFAVYNDGVKITVPEGTKGKVGGFAVSGRTPTKLGTEIDYFKVTADSTRVYINDTAAIKGTVGGFAVSGRTPTKLGEFDYLRVTPDSTRVYVNEGFTKGTVGGFAVSGRTPTKTKLNSYFLSTMDSTRIYVSDTITKGTVGGFAVSGRTPTKGDPLKFMDITKNNYLIGQEAGMSITTGRYNSYMGYQAGKYTKSGSRNIFLGFQAGLKTDNAYENIFIGHRAGNQNIGGNWNTFLGNEAGYNNTGSDNTFIGFQAGRAHQNQGGNVYIGSKAGRDATNGQQNVYIGESTGLSTTYGTSNVFIGYQSGMNNKGSGSDPDRGSYNVYLGYQAGLNGDYVYRNVFLGYQAGMNTIAGAGDPKEGSVNVFIGSEAGLSNTTGFANTAIGEQALKSNTIGKGNVALGRMPLINNIDGEYNVSIGNQSLYNNKSGVANVALGVAALWNNDSGDWNVAMGNMSLYNNQTGNGNVALGSTALYSLVSGNKNVAIGSAALTLSLDSANVAIGAFALSFLNRGVKNTAIGNGANVQSNLVEYNNSTAIGYSATIVASNQVVIGNNDVTNVTIPGVYNATTVSEASNVYVNSVGQIMQTTVPTATGTGTASKIAFWDGVGTSTLSYSTNLHWDNTNNRLGISASNPSYDLSFGGSTDRIIGVETRTGTLGTGRSLTIIAGKATMSNYNGGTLILSSGIATGSGVSEIQFNTVTASDLNPSTKMVIKGNGFVGIGTTGPTVALHVVGNARFTAIGSGTYAAPVNQTSTGILTTATSDIRFKENINTLSKSLDKVMKLRGVSFTWKSEPQMGTRIGLIAQEVEPVLPELVFTNPVDGFMGVNYAEMSAVLVEAIKEQQSIIINLRNENNQLKTDYLEMKKEIELIKVQLKK